MGKKSVQNILLVLKPKTLTNFYEIIPNLCSWLQRRKRSIYFLEKEKSRIEKIFKSVPSYIQFLPEQKILKFPDLVITLGGDGTLIGVSRKTTRNSPQIFGINMGRLGFIAEFSKGDFYEGLESAIKGTAQFNKISLYKVEVMEKEKVISTSHFLNDVVFNRSEISRMINLNIDINDEHVNSIAGDGLIVSSPIGSTAYSLAAGGPIIHPHVNVLTMTPICPHSLTNRSIVIPESSSVSVVSNNKKEEVNMTLDGQEVHVIGPYQKVVITKSKTRYAKFVINPERTFFRTLKTKLTYG